MELSDEALHQALAKWDRSERWDGSSASLQGDLEVKRLTPELAQDYLSFFDKDAFADNPAWSSCYCFFYQWDGNIQAWEKRTAPQNRESKCSSIMAGRARGLLAYAGRKPVGWCHAAPTTELPLLMNDEDVRRRGVDGVGSIVCFVVAPAHRGQGVARRLLSEACDYLRDLGMSTVEAMAPSADERSQARNYHGSLSMYLAAGFKPLEKENGFTVVRKDL